MSLRDKFKEWFDDAEIDEKQAARQHLVVQALIQEHKDEVQWLNHYIRFVAKDSAEKEKMRRKLEAVEQELKRLEHTEEEEIIEGLGLARYEDLSDT